MSIRESWVISCDLTACGVQRIGQRIGSGRASRFHRRHTLIDAGREGWGRIAVGNFGQHVDICPDCRKLLLQESDPGKFRRVITDGDHGEYHSVLLDCGHEFTKVEIGPDSQVECSACFRNWFITGEVIGLNELGRIAPRIVPEETP